MTHRKVGGIALFLAILLLSACSGGTSGSVRNSSQTCTALGGNGSCEGRFGRLSGTYGIDIEDEGIGPSDLVLVEVTASVEVGSLRVFLEGPEGETNSIEVNPGTPVQLVGYAQGEFDGFEIGFQALGEFAEGVNYSLRYVIE
jgi:hypothetical protein